MEAKDPAARIERVEYLLLEARVLISRKRPVDAINRITTLWSVCHSSRQDVPEDSHRLFAQAVSLLSLDQDRVGTLAREEQIKTKTTAGVPEHLELIEPALPPRAQKEPRLTIPIPDYPLAKSGPGPACSKTVTTVPAPPPPVSREDGLRSPGFPPPPRPERSGPLPFPPAPGGSTPPPGQAGGGAFPPPPLPPGAAPRRGPLDAGPGGPPPGYYDYTAVR